MKTLSFLFLLLIPLTASAQNEIHPVQKNQTFQFTERGDLCDFDMNGSCACPKALMKAGKVCEAAGFENCVIERIKIRAGKNWPVIGFIGDPLNGKCTVRMIGTQDAATAQAIHDAREARIKAEKVSN